MEQISKVITVEEHFMSEKVNGEYQKLFEKKNLTLAQTSFSSLSRKEKLQRLGRNVWNLWKHMELTARF